MYNTSNNVPRNVAEPLRGDRQTNQRAELVAIARALDHIPIDRSAKIITDSNYSIKCLTEWFQKWEDKGWKNAAGKPVENKDLIEPILARIRERDMCRATTKFEWVKGHNNDPGNVAADIAAVEGSRKSTPELRAGQHRDISVTLRTPTRSHHALQNHFRPKVEPALEDLDDGGFDEIFADLAAEQDANEARNATVVHMDESAVVNERLAGAVVGQGNERIGSVDSKVDGGIA
jgi:ribonuclease HI